ncbi:MAG: hypothetical protein HOM97_14085 [Nitrospina sp.]|jgi:hypothetical protein|nr:hypothetical protein [Nitrospina sp.]
MNPEEENIDWDYDIIIRVKKGKYFLYMKELQLLAKGETLEAAYQDLSRKKETLKREFFGLEDLILLPPLSGSTVPYKAMDSSYIIRFLFKSGVIGALIIIIISFSMTLTEVRLNAFISNLAMNKAYVFTKTANWFREGLHKLADEEISKEEQQKFIESARILAKRFKPIVEELKPLFPSESETTLPTAFKNALNTIDLPPEN